MAKKVDYPAIKKALWEAWRIFFVAFVGVVVVQFEAGVNLMDWKNVIPAIVSAGAIAGVKAVVKWARDKYGKGDYSKFIYKLPL